METLRKLSIGGINGVRKGFKNVKERTHVARIVGIARVPKVEENDGGTYTKFIGEFKAWNSEAAEFIAPVAFFPGEAESALIDALAGDGGHGVEFAYDFFIVPAQNRLGYVWETLPLVSVRKSDPLGALLAQVTPLERPAVVNAGVQETPENVPEVAKGEMEDSSSARPENAAEETEPRTGGRRKKAS